jgi:hypothetical protein
MRTKDLGNGWAVGIEPLADGVSRLRLFATDEPANFEIVSEAATNGDVEAFEAEAMRLAAPEPLRGRYMPERVQMRREARAAARRLARRRGGA